MNSLVAFQNLVKCTFCYFTGGFGGYNSRGQRGGNRGNRGNRGSGYSNNGGYNRGRGGNNYMNGGGNRNNYGNGNRGNRSGMLSLCCICSALFIQIVFNFAHFPSRIIYYIYVFKHASNGNHNIMSVNVVGQSNNSICNFSRNHFFYSTNTAPNCKLFSAKHNSSCFLSLLADRITGIMCSNYKRMKIYHISSPRS